jgi:hypothetical protein
MQSKVSFNVYVHSKSQHASGLAQWIHKIFCTGIHPKESGLASEQYVASEYPPTNPKFALPTKPRPRPIWQTYLSD